MRTFTRDPTTNDIVIRKFASTSSNLVISDLSVDSGREAVGDVVEAIVKTERGELDLDQDSGIRHTNLLSYGESMLSFWKDDMTNAVRGCEYVSSITGFDVDYNRQDGVVNYVLSMSTEYGDVEVKSASETPAKVVRYATEPDLTFNESTYPDPAYDATELTFDFTIETLAEDPTVVVRVRKMEDVPTVTVYWMDGTRDVVSNDGNVTLKHVYSKSNGNASIVIGHGAEWLAVGSPDNETSSDPTRKFISGISRFATTILSLDRAFVYTPLKKADYTKPSLVSTDSWNSAFTS